ncbi:MAG: ROK family transcriptional regulator, partial [Clostridiaceae bacterium]|nr:ROK family transcriptional regulator [Clostridiaceae bacterium]
MRNILKLDKNKMRQNNVRLIFETIYRNHGITRAQLAAKTKISAMNVGRIVDFLIERGLVAEHGDTDTGTLGRPGKRLELCREKVISLGVSIDVGGVSIGLVDPYGKIISSEHRFFDVKALCPEDALQETAKMIVEFMSAQGFSADRIGVVVPGIMNPDKGYAQFSSQLGWHNLPVA